MCDDVASGGRFDCCNSLRWSSAALQRLPDSCTTHWLAGLASRRAGMPWLWRYWSSCAQKLVRRTFRALHQNVSLVGTSAGNHNSSPLTIGLDLAGKVLVRHFAAPLSCTRLTKEDNCCLFRLRLCLPSEDFVWRLRRRIWILLG